MNIFKVYDNLCQRLLPFTQRNQSNMFRISDAEGLLGIKKGNEVVVLIKVGDRATNKYLAQSIITRYHHKYPFLRAIIHTDENGKQFNYTDLRDQSCNVLGIDETIDCIKQIVCKKESTPKMISLLHIDDRNNIESYKYGDKQILLFDDHRTTLDVLFEIYHSKQTDGLLPNLVTFDYHEDCCDAGSKESLLEKIGVADIAEASPRQFWSFTEFDISKSDDDWISVAMKLDLVKDVVIIGNQANHNVDNHANTETGQHNIYSIGHLSGEVGNRGCLGDSINKESYYQQIRDTMQFHDHHFDEGMVYPFVLDIDLDCFSAEILGHQAAWPEHIFYKEYVEDVNTFCFMQQLISRASIITISREPGCCGGLSESNKIFGYLDKYFFGGALCVSPFHAFQ